MLKIFKLSNVKDWKTTFMAILGGVLMMLGVLMPEKFTTENNEIILDGFNQIVVGIGSLITIFTSIFGAKDGDTK